MAENRLELHEKLVKCLGTENVYFQPGPNVQMEYPCIVYSRDGLYRVDADDALYYGKIRYVVTLIEKNPDSPVLEKLWKLQFSEYSRHYTFDNLHHDVFEIYS